MRRVVLIIACAVTIVLAAACSSEGQSEPPTVNEIKRDGVWYDDVDPDTNTPLRCMKYAEVGADSSGNAIRWFAITCREVQADLQQYGITVDNG